ncbi:pyridoxamine 5'-phosphate oxidase family protein [Spirillospora sp. NPDC049652]
MTDAAIDTALDRAACLNLLGTVTVGRIAWCTCDGRVIVVPVAFVLDGETIVVRAVGGSRVRAVRTGRLLTFEADDIDPAHQTGWSVLVKGAAEVIEDREGVPGASVPAAWADDPASFLVRIPATDITGHRLTP